VCTRRAHLQLLQEIRLQDAGDGRQLPQGGADRRSGGCDLLTISPDLLEALQKRPGEITPKLTIENARASSEEKITLDEKTYRWMHNQDAMAVEKLSRRHSPLLRRRPQARDSGRRRQSAYRVNTRSCRPDSPLRGLAGRPALVVLLRSFGCTFCREAMADVAAAKHAIHDAGANVAFVHGASTPKRAVVRRSTVSTT
jgi:hypothetical protein